MTINMQDVRVRIELKDQVKELVNKYYDRNLYAASTRTAVCKDIAALRDELIDRYKVSVPIVALYVGEYGRVLKAKLLTPTLLKGDGCVGFCKEPEGGGIAELRVEKISGRHN